MDEIDVIISLQLLVNSRISYRELARITNLSVNSVHVRVQNLIEKRIIRNFKAEFSLDALKANRVIYFGKLNHVIDEGLLFQLADNEFIYWISISSGNYAYIGSYIRQISEIGIITEYLGRDVFEKIEFIGIVEEGSSKIPSGLKLKEIDFKIAEKLKENSRKTVSDLSVELNITRKTAKFHLNKLIENNLMEFRIDWYPELSNDIITFINIKLKNHQNKYKLSKDIIQKHFPYTLFAWTFSNISNFIFLATWCPNMKKFSELKEDLEKNNFSILEPNIIFKGHLLPSWREKIKNFE